MKVNYKVATKWNELNDWQLSIIGRLLYNNKQLERKEFQWIIAFVLILQKPTIKNFFRALKFFSKLPFSEVKPHTEFIFDESSRLTNFPPKIKVGRFGFRKTLFGPAARLANISITELSYADTFYYNYITAGNEIDLRRLVACLYRTAKKGTPRLTDKRTDFDKLLLPDFSKLTDKIPLPKMYVIMLAYQGSRNVIIDRYKHVFPKPYVDPDAPEPPKPKKPKPYHPFSKIVNSMAMDEVQVFGTLQETEKVNAMDFLSAYDELLLRQKNRP